MGQHVANPRVFSHSRPLAKQNPFSKPSNFLQKAQPFRMGKGDFGLVWDGNDFLIFIPFTFFIVTKISTP
jgi:hypothetical protein